MDLILKPDCQLQIDMIAEQHKKFMQQLRGHHYVKNLRSIGTIMAFEIEQGTDGYMNTISARVTQKALEKGVYLRPLGNTLYLMPPYCITREELQKVYDVVVKILKTL